MLGMVFRPGADGCRHIKHQDSACAGMKAMPAYTDNSAWQSRHQRSSEQPLSACCRGNSAWIEMIQSCTEYRCGELAGWSLRSPGIRVQPLRYPHANTGLMSRVNEMLQQAAPVKACTMEAAWTAQQAGRQLPKQSVQQHHMWRPHLCLPIAGKRGSSGSGARVWAAKLAFVGARSRAGSSGGSQLFRELQLRGRGARSFNIACAAQIGLHARHAAGGIQRQLPRGLYALARQPAEGHCPAPAQPTSSKHVHEIDFCRQVLGSQYCIY